MTETPDQVGVDRVTTATITRTERAFLALEASYRALFDAVNEAIFVQDLATGAILDVNRRVCDLYGYSADEVRQLNIESLSAGEPPYTQEEALRRVQLAARGEQQVFEWQARKRNGQVFWVEVNLRRATIGGVERLLALVSDISARKQAEAERVQLIHEQAARAAAEAAQKRFQRLLEAAPDAIVISDAAGHIVLVNSQTERLFGYARDEMVGQKIEILLPEQIRAWHAGQRAAYPRGRHNRPMEGIEELYGRRKDGSEFPAEISLSPLDLDDGEFITSIIRDITERKTFEQQLKQQAEDLARSNADLQQFAYVASHDLQEPLRMVASYTQLLARRYKGKLDPDADEFVNFAVTGAIRMQELIQDLLAYSRVGTRGRRLAPTNCQVVVDNVIRDLQAAIVEAEAVVSHAELPVVVADATQLNQVFQNLIANAIKFRGAEPPRVHVSAEPDGDFWRIAVRDNGIGIDPQYAERIFVIFQRLHAAHEYPGTGIGLAICKKIVERHGGRIWFESQPDEGSTFFFTLPNVGRTPIPLTPLS